MKKLQSILIILAVMLTLTVGVFADEIPSERLMPRFYDEYGAVGEVGANEINELLDEISVRQGVDVAIAIVNSTNGQYIRDFADDYYDYNGFGFGSGADGLILVIAMDSREWWISTCGYGITAFTDAGIEYIGDEIVYYLSAGDYYGAFTEFASLCDSFITQAKTGEPYDYGNMPKAPISAMHFIIAIAFGVIVAFIGTGILKSQLKSVAPQAAAHSYIKSGSVNIVEKRDIYLYRNVSKTARPKDNGGGGGSSTHTSSSGRSHGCGGGRF